MFAFMLLVASATALPFACVDTGGDCTGGAACCMSSDHCEAVNQYYSKCVTQPKCAKDNAQCAGKGQSVMEPTACCTKGFTCHATNEWYSSCINASVPIPPPPPPTPAKNCSDTGSQCGGGSFSPLPCCDAESQCEVVNNYFSKCVDQPKCVKENAVCEGTGDHIMKATPCCDAGHTCVAWGDDWNVCRKSGEEKCAAHGEQCAGTGASAMKEKACCTTGDKCIAVNQYYSKCDTPTAADVISTTVASCPGLEKCPTAQVVEAA